MKDVIIIFGGPQVSAAPYDSLENMTSSMLLESAKENPTLIP